MGHSESVETATEDDMKPRTLATIALAAGLAAFGAPGALAQTGDGPVVDDFAAGDFGRVRLAENGATVVRADATGGARDDRLGTNSPVFPGDLVRTGRDQRVEIELAGGSLVRMDRDSALTFQALPDPYTEHPDNTVLVVDYGSIQITARPSSNEDFRVDTPAASVYLVGDGNFRIDVEEGGMTSVLSRRGVTEVVGAKESVLVRAGLVTEVSPGGDPSSPRRLTVYSADAFDRWAADRDRLAAQWRVDDDLEADDLPSTVQPYYRELSAHGQWAYEPTYGNVWYPSGVAAGWRPYYDGYWSYSPRGYFWVSNEPWGWAPYHYGRWVYVNAYGWGWSPGRIFAGAWVSWSWGSAYIGWAPLDYWNGPAYYHSTLYHGYYDPHCWNFVRYDHIAVHDYHRYYVPVNRIHDHIGGNAVITRPPRVAPQALVRDAALRERSWRDAKAEKAARVAPVRRDSTTRNRFVDAEDRAVRSGAIRKAADVGRTVRAPERTTVSTQRGNVSPRSNDRPRKITSTTEVKPRPSRGSDLRGNDRGVSETRSLERPRPSNGSAAPRRSDARSVERPRPENQLRGDGSDTTRRLREFYRDAGRPVEPQRPPEAQRERGNGSADRGRSDVRPAERPRQEPARPAPRAEPRQEPRPERAAPRSEPRRDDGGRKAAPKKDDGGGSKSGDRGRGR
jgi:hypothetical protein